MSRQPTVHTSARKRIFVGALPIKIDFSTLVLTEDIVREYFSNFGEIFSLKLAKNKNSKESLGFAFLEFKSEESSNKVLSQKHFLNGREVTKSLSRSTSNLLKKAQRSKNRTKTSKEGSCSSKAFTYLLIRPDFNRSSHSLVL